MSVIDDDYDFVELDVGAAEDVLVAVALVVHVAGVNRTGIVKLVSDFAIVFVINNTLFTVSIVVVVDDVNVVNIVLNIT